MTVRETSNETTAFELLNLRDRVALVTRREATWVRPCSSPKYIAIVAFGSVERQGGINRRIATVAVDKNEVGRMAAGLLEQMTRSRQGARVGNQ